MTLIEKFDAVLDVLYSESGKSPTFEYIQEVLAKNSKDVHWGEVWDILNTMNKDGFLYIVSQDNKERYLLSFNGKLLKETGGLEAKLKREKDREILTNQQITSTIKTDRFSRRSTRVSIGLALLVMGLQFYTIYRENSKNKESALKEKKELVQQQKIIQNDSIMNQELHWISLPLQDTAKV